MAVVGKIKQDIINQFKTNENDSGSSQVQIAILTKKIENLTEHFKTHKKDHSSRRGLLRLVSRRRRLLDYLKKNNKDSYIDVVKKLGLRK